MKVSQQHEMGWDGSNDGNACEMHAIAMVG